MPCRLIALCFDANDPLRLARFWAGVLGWEMADDPQDGSALLPSDDTGIRIRFLPTQEQKTGQNQMHFDLRSTSLEDQQQTVASDQDRTSAPCIQATDDRAGRPGDKVPRPRVT
jgi:hypothetical protein